MTISESQSGPVAPLPPPPTETVETVETVEIVETVHHAQPVKEVNDPITLHHPPQKDADTTTTEDPEVVDHQEVAEEDVQDRTVHQVLAVTVIEVIQDQEVGRGRDVLDHHRVQEVAWS